MSAFPPEFMWGASQSAHSIEGGNFASDWWRWEQRAGRIADGATSKEASHFFERFETDLDLAHDFGLNAFFYNVEWSRIQPEPGVFDDEALAHYRRVFEAMRARGIEAVCALHHVTLPRWFAERYRWSHPESAGLFTAYAERVVEALAPVCRWWVPVREPMHTISMSRIERRWPRTERRLTRSRLALLNLGAAHAEVYRVIHDRQPDAMVGAAIHARAFRPVDPHSPWDIRTALREERRCNRIFLDGLSSGAWPLQLRKNRQTADTLDFIAVAHYGIEHLRFALLRPGRLFGQPCDAAGKPLKHSAPTPYPESLLGVLRDLAGYGKPLIVSAHGIATGDDVERCRFLVNHVGVLRRALDEGIDLRGYFHRSWLDGFEWDRGYADRYGLVYVDLDTQSRTPNPSAFLYKELCKTGTISPGAVARYCPQAATPGEPQQP